MTALLFALFLVSFAAPAITAGLVALTARTRNTGLITLIIVETIVVTLAIALHCTVYSLYRSWDGGGIIMLAYLISGICSGVALALATDKIRLLP